MSTGFKVSQNRVWVWGSNSYGQIGINNNLNTSVPIETVAGDTDWQIVAVGNYHSAGIKKNKSLWLWGLGDSGILGDGTNAQRWSPVQTIAGGNDWKQVDGGAAHTVALKTDGSFWIWGRNNFGQLGVNDITHRSSPVQTVAGGTNWAQVAAGDYHSGGIKTDGTLWLWGKNDDGELGINTVGHRSSPVQVTGAATDWRQLSLGAYVSAAIKTDGTLWTWGGGWVGQLGNESRAGRSSPAQTVSGGTNWNLISCGSYHMMAIKSDGTLWTWGHNDHGQLGDNTRIHRSSPVQTVSGGTNWRTVSGGDSYSTAIKTDGTLWLWGRNTLGQLGDNSITHRSSPVQIYSAGTTWKSVVASGYSHTIAMTSDFSDFDDLYVRRDQFTEGGLWGWGDNPTSLLGDGTSTDRSSPVQISGGGSNWVDVNSTYGTTALMSAGLRSNGAIFVWGSLTTGVAGDTTTQSGTRTTPSGTVAGGPYAKMSIAFRNGFAIKTDGSLWAWGHNATGSVGDNTQVHRSSPVQTVAGGTDWKAVKHSAHAISALKVDGTLWVWGNNNSGALGDNTITHRSSPVQTVAGGTNWKSLIGGDHLGGIKTDGTLWSWGDNTYGCLGDGTNTNRSSPVQVLGTGIWRQACIGGVSAGIKNDGTLWVWGASYGGSLGQLSPQEGAHKSSPIQIGGGGTNWKSVATGSVWSVAAIKTDGTLWVWGANTVGALGDGTILHRSSPVQTLAGGTNWKKVVGGSRDTFLAIREDIY